MVIELILAAQAKRAGSDPITTYISMTTDGRPERRAWWDTRKGPGSDSLTGQEVRLPDALGGDAITTSRVGRQHRCIGVGGSAHHPECAG